MFYNEGPRSNGLESKGTLILYVVIFFSLFIGLSVIRHNIFLGNTDNTHNGKWPEFELSFCTLYDSFTMVPTVTWNFTLIICAVIAIVSPYQVDGINRTIVMPLMLLYIFSLDKTLNFIVKAIYQAHGLFSTLYLFAVCSLVFFMFAQVAEMELVFDDMSDDPDNVCDPKNPYKNLMSCFMLVFDKTIPAGEMSAVLADINPPYNDVDGWVPSLNTDFTLRFIIDILFFIVFSVILFNVVTGLIVDNFTQLRVESQERALYAKNECFVCGYSRGAFDDLGASYNFEEHIGMAHFTWNYVFFVYHLTNKNEDEYNGVESHVFDYYRQKNYDWIPTRTSWKIQADELRVKKKQTAEMMLMTNVGKMVNELAQNQAKLEKDTREKLEALQQGHSNTIEKLDLLNTTLGRETPMLRNGMVRGDPTREI